MVILRWLDRQFGPDGRGSPYPTRRFGRQYEDLRNTDIYTSFQWYLNENWGDLSEWKWAKKCDKKCDKICSFSKTLFLWYCEKHNFTQKWAKNVKNSQKVWQMWQKKKRFVTLLSHPKSPKSPKLRGFFLCVTKWHFFCCFFIYKINIYEKRHHKILSHFAYIHKWHKNTRKGGVGNNTWSNM